MVRLILLVLAFLPLAANAAEADASAVMARMQLTINHGVSIAVDGANLVLQASHGEEAVDKAAEQQGRELIVRGKALVVEAASGATMMKLHAQELTASESAQMITIHRLEGSALAYLKALESL